ncbi:hypothetical protein HZS_3205 [Henneguya salminicola]|nr:hypothetical protein HZS_3205 [Henneguya salminicola]
MIFCSSSQKIALIKENITHAFFIYLLPTLIILI